tara:strand:- start:180 stop:1481 length:1302 start_codon:yes stop_codon:yes gene_type:complete
VNENIIKSVLDHYDLINDWLTQLEVKADLPFYSSVDIRDAGFKVAAVDTNLFPAGFNNICEVALKEAEQTFKKAVLHRVPTAQKLLLIIEEHTRNTWYLENVYVLEQLMKSAGFEVVIASFLSDSIKPQSSHDPYISLKTAKNNSLTVYCLDSLLTQVHHHVIQFDLIILNHDLTTGIPTILRQTQIPIYPSIQAGWHSRLKSKHFAVANTLLDEFASMIGIDPWFFSCLYTSVESVDINDITDRNRIKDSAERLFSRIQAKYKLHKINQKPFVFLKSDSGTYGMGVMPIESPDDILEFNRKTRNNLAKGKNARKIGRFILQEGVPTINTVQGKVSEACIYQIANQFVGGFYRLNDQKTNRQNLNSKGMGFRKMCNNDHGDCIYSHQKKCNGNLDIDPKTQIYYLLARIAGVAAHREMVQMTSQLIPELVTIR